MVSSTALMSEISRTANLERKQRVLDSLEIAVQQVQVTEAMVQRAAVLQEPGFKAFDALYLACAEAAAVNCFLSTDDRLIRRSAKTVLSVAVNNPVDWFMAATAINDSEFSNGG